MNTNPEKHQYSIVLIGDFNPAMFHPEWFKRNNIIPPEDVDVARDQSQQNSIIVTPQLTIFKTSQLNIKVDQNRFEVVADKEPFISVIDFATKTFDNLGGYIIKAFGFNYSAHYRVDDVSMLQRIGDNLAPKIYWKTLLGDEITGDNRRSGLTAIQMQKYKTDDTGQYTVILQPSNFIRPGIFMSCNDHTNLSAENNLAENVIDNIIQTYEKSLEFMEKIQTDLIAEVIK